jgi:hypothetical protein
LGTLRNRGFTHHGERRLAASGCQIFNARENCEKAPRTKTSVMARMLHSAASLAFAQILRKLFFFELSENLRRILLYYGQKLPDPRNAPFNAAC